ncbi:MAG: tRNA (adenosine(37)-N6)-dimethylallyltransferase MiaA [Beijerinckiaceae bacterium]|nr:tRNA (adenosine(37)-N6)-dimethylallyltransferase MiaA [Beijerinckiaceae bacterium]MCI0736020.1 tRNA (adenosine(37)-N6)-dimethylallyltransferase MiaA [Beijerinckiaceae bacterium]
MAEQKARWSNAAVPLTRISAILIAGPTASGKSALALRLGAGLGGMVINADSMQVYRDLRVVTARPGREDEAMAPHRLFGHVDGAVNYSTGLWLADAARALDDARCEGRLPVVVGGTGLYFKALTQGLSEIPPVPEEVRAKIRARAANIPAGELHAELMRRDPASAARLRPSDPQRILRALEVFESTGQSLVSFHAKRAPPLLDAREVFAVFLAAEKEILNERIDARFDSMLRAGAMQEAAALRERRLDKALPVMRAHGVAHLIAYLDGEISLPEAAKRAKGDTRSYAKRQMTFARHQLASFQWTNPETAEALALAVVSKVNGARK